jgi:branched-subunit amino acid transport protein
MVTSYTDPVLWGLIGVIGVLTYLIRLSFIALFGYVDEIPSGLERVLRYVPAAVLGALVFPAFVTFDPGTGGLAADKIIAGGAAGFVAWWRESVLVTMTVGMGTLWLLRFVILPIV